jgi:hypothetical protein
MTEIDLAAEAAKLHDLDVKKSELGKQHDEAKREHKQQEQNLLTLLERAGLDSLRPRGLEYVFTAVDDKVKGQLEDRGPYFKWALEREPSLAEFVETSCNVALSEEEFAARLHDALMNLSILKLSERQDLMNQQARKASDDEQPLPPGLGSRPVPYVSVVKR